MNDCVCVVCGEAFSGYRPGNKYCSQECRALAKVRRSVQEAEQRRAYNRIYARKFRDAAHAALGGVCVRCGFADTRALQIDHVHGGGGKECRGRNATSYYKQVIAQALSGKYQLLCANCNWIKRSENYEERPRMVA